MAKTKTHARKRSKTPVFDAMIEEARQSPRNMDISLEELDRRLAITDEERKAVHPTIDRWLREDAEDEAARASGGGAHENGQAARARTGAPR